MTRRDFFHTSTAALPAAASGPALAATAAFAWSEATLQDLQQAQSEGRASAVSLAQDHLQRIAQLDGALKSLIELNPQAEAIAHERDAERRAGRIRGHLHGVPIVIKDNIASLDRMATSAGSPALAGQPARAEAPLLGRLREGGAVLIGKSNLSEWANFRGKGSISGWSSRGGQTRNPYALDRSPSGSSSGSATAVASSLAVLAVGTETDGSITSPCSVQGLVGLKPTHGLISAAGIIPIAPSFDCAGPMARTVRDAATMLAAMAQPRPGFAQALLNLAPQALRGARLGVVRNLVEGHSRATQALFESACQRLREGGATVVEAPMPSAAAIGEPQLEVLITELAPAMAQYLSDYAAANAPRSLAELAAYNRVHPHTLAWFGQEWFEASLLKTQGLQDPHYRRQLARARRLARAEGIDKLLRSQQLDALIAPTTGPAWLIDPLRGDHDNAPSATTPAAVAGYPHLTVPMGLVGGLPVGLSLMGTAWQEPRLLALGAHFEQLGVKRPVPTFQASAHHNTSSA